VLSLVIACGVPLPTLPAGTLTETVLIAALLAAGVSTPTIRNSCFGPGVSVSTQADAAGAAASAARPATAAANTGVFTR